MNRKEAENNIIKYALAAFTNCKDFEPASQSLTTRIFWDDAGRCYRLVAYNDAYLYDECKPILIHGHFNEIKDMDDYVAQAKEKDIKFRPVAQCQKVPTDFPTLFSVDEVIDIFDGAVTKMIAELKKYQGIAQKEIKVTKLCLDAFREQLCASLSEAETNE